MESKLMQILEGLLNEFEEWRRGESDKEPLIIEIHDKVVSNDPYTEQGVINLGVGLSLRFHEFVFNLSSSCPLFPSPCRLRER